MSAIDELIWICNDKLIGGIELRDAAELEVVKLRADNAELRRLVRAVKVCEFEGIYCEDVDGQNWFDKQKECK